jgi:hypothetical protein
MFLWSVSIYERYQHQPDLQRLWDPPVLLVDVPTVAVHVDDSHVVAEKREGIF